MWRDQAELDRLQSRLDVLNDDRLDGRIDAAFGNLFRNCGFRTGQFTQTIGGYPPQAPILISGGEGGIRTHGTRKGSTVFETARFNRSRTSPHRTTLIFPQLASIVTMPISCLFWPKSANVMVLSLPHGPHSRSNTGTGGGGTSGAIAMPPAARSALSGGRFHGSRSTCQVRPANLV